MKNRKHSQVSIDIDFFKNYFQLLHIQIGIINKILSKYNYKDFYTLQLAGLIFCPHFGNLVIYIYRGVDDYILAFN